MKVNIVDLDHKGNGIAKIDNKVVFIPKCIVGDCVEVDIVSCHKKYNEGRIREFISVNDDRIESLCPYYVICGGCNISNLNYQMQLEYKRNKIINIFNRYLGININPEIVGSDNRYEYRNKITFKCNNGKLGLISIDNQFINVDRCELASSKVNQLVEYICHEDLSNVEKIIIKECDNGLILGIYGKMDIDNIKDMCLSIYINDKIICKNDEGYINIGGFKYRVSLSSFFQINTKNISKLYDIVVKYGNFSKSDNVIDLYCGVGSIGLYVAKYVNSVLGIEIVEQAIIDANENAKINNIDNVEFICGDVSNLINKDINGNVVIVDPPRTGLDDCTIDVINNIDIDKLIYVSCDPMTLVRDLKKLDKYNISDITVVDMFPQTHHCEVVVLLKKAIM